MHCFQTLCLNVWAAEEMSLKALYDTGLTFTRALPPLASVLSANLFVPGFVSWAYFSLKHNQNKTWWPVTLCCPCFACMLLLVIQVDPNELLCCVQFIGVKWDLLNDTWQWCIGCWLWRFFCFHYQNWLPQWIHMHTLLPWPGSCHLKLGSSRSSPTPRPPLCCTRWWASTSCPCASSARNR